MCDSISVRYSFALSNISSGTEYFSCLARANACATMAADPLIRHVATPRWFNEVRATQARLRESATLLKVPTFMPVAGDDRLVDSAAAIAFAAAAGHIVDLKVYERLFHELYLETERDVVIADVVDWLSRRFVPVA